MGAWGRGILQNDGAQDSLCEVANDIEEATWSLGETRTDITTARLEAAIGMLAQFSPYSLSPDNEADHPRLVETIRLHAPPSAERDPELTAMLEAICRSEAPEYNVISFSPELETAFHGPGATTFIVQKTWAKPPAGCFDKPAARAFVQEVADKCVATVDEEFADEEVLNDLCREGFSIGSLALLLVLTPIDVEPACFERWRDAFRSAQGEQDPGEAEFFATYGECMDKALAYGLSRFSA